MHQGPQTQQGGAGAGTPCIMYPKLSTGVSHSIRVPKAPGTPRPSAGVPYA